MTAEEKFKQVIRMLHKKGVYPAPTMLNMMIHGHNSDNINGRETKWRREMMKELGIPLQRPGASRAAFEQMHSSDRVFSD
jgi:hypothetical protein